MTSKEEQLLLAKEFGYEGAGVILTNSLDEILFIVSEKDGKLQAEIGGGKPEREDDGSSLKTALRELREETGIELKDTDLIQELQTTGGNSGFPSIQYLTKPLDHVQVQPREQFMDAVWSKIHHPSPKEWYIRDPKGQVIPIRKFNSFFFAQHESKLKSYFTDSG